VAFLWDYLSAISPSNKGSHSPLRGRTGFRSADAFFPTGVGEGGSGSLSGESLVTSTNQSDSLKRPRRMEGFVTGVVSFWKMSSAAAASDNGDLEDVTATLDSGRVPPPFSSVTLRE